jgi:hypothetical protein
VAFATVLITTPFDTTVYSGGQTDATVVWKDDGAAPSLATFGHASISIYVGNRIQQTSLQVLKPDVDVSTTSTITFTPDPTIGPNGNDYFIRIQSLANKDSTGTPLLAFSGKFTLQNMTGNFSAAVQSQIAGQSTAPLGPTSSGASSAASSTSSGAASSASLTASGTSKTSSSTTSATAKPSNAATGLKAGWAGIVFGAVVGVTMF